MERPLCRIAVRVCELAWPRLFATGREFRAPIRCAFRPRKKVTEPRRSGFFSFVALADAEVHYYRSDFTRT